MSEEILKALTQLFAIITKQDGGVTEKERQYVITFFQTELDKDSVKEYLALYDQFSGYGKEEDEGKSRLTSVKDSVKTLGICKKINKTLTQKQKVVVLIKLLELVGTDKNFSPQRREIINTVSTVFNITEGEYELIENFVITDNAKSLAFPDILLLNSEHADGTKTYKHVHGHIQGNLVFMRVRSVEMYFTKYLGDEANILNGFPMQPNRVYLFSHGSTIKTQAGDALYYSDLVANYNEELKTTKLSFNAAIDELKFPNGGIGLRNVLISEGPGKLIGIMGASGAGKTTLLNVLAGLVTPTQGRILINGFDIHEQKEKIHGVIGYVSQDDLLIEELTVYQNLYYNAKLCFADFTEEQLHKRVMEVLENLGLDQRKDLRVGNALDKTISGGQRKRLNIALELIREPAILFLDEPTSGLSSRDSENVIDLLKELSLKGKLIFVVIHQPSSDIYKMFDKMIIMDTGGYQAYYGPPVEAITYFKKSTLQVDSNRGQCETCGNVNPEQIFNIIEAKVVDEYGQPTSKRKITPPQWYDLYKERFKINRVEDVKEEPPHSLNLPSKIKQTIIFTIRDTLAKISNKQYLLINLLEGPLLALILAFIIKYRSAPGGKEYMFRFNDNFPAFMLMSIIVALFMGLTVSAEEIIRDRKILKRESFLNLSWNSYLLSKISILFVLSAIQTLTFVLVGHLILEIEWSMLLPFWFVLFTTSCMANVLGLNISSAFNSAVTVYVMIPLLLIPQMILSGLLFSFDKLNNMISTKGKVPIVADMMASRWAYEAMAVYQFKNNSYEEPYYALEKVEAQSDFNSSFLVDELNKRRKFINDNISQKNDSVRATMGQYLAIIQNTIQEEPYYKKGLEGLNLNKAWTLNEFTSAFDQKLDAYFTGYKKFYQDAYNKAVNERERRIYARESEKGSDYKLNDYKNRYHNESLADLVTNISVKDRVIEFNGKLYQQINPVFLDPKPEHALDYRTHFFAPRKNLFGVSVDTYWFDILIIWVMSAILYLTLYFEVFRKIINAFDKVPGMKFKMPLPKKN
ncbi:ATP-binding cassette domain-containing protein [Chryseosolibacter indicus]|uniref:ATP-binding cassette domain-containing protein n=1 Tax=Chryseosolibacter indicus TaxID=2782351 RepID=A0ABS5VS07_9BACT|nr:ATP-binding cassette domain-containing protein [Chryseosolibacter indicus]MBT1702796.1 ATP-binding cassette domain-containing protein [Chryseosolibacter indicus]